MTVGFEGKNKFICAFCGGKSCKHENYEENPNKNPIDGL